MSFTAALIIFVIGIAIGYLLPMPVAKLKQFYRRQTFRPKLLRPHVWDERKVEPTVNVAANKTKAPLNHSQGDEL
jgi:hypothetical protein